MIFLLYKMIFCIHVWMSSVFEMLFLIRFLVIYLLSSWDDMDVRVELLADDVWSAEYDKTGSLFVENDSFESITFERTTDFPCPWCKVVTKNENMRNKDNLESSTNRNMTFFYESSKYYIWLSPPPYGKIRKIENFQLIHFDECF